MKPGGTIIAASLLTGALLLAFPGCVDADNGGQWTTVDSTIPQGDVALYRDVQFQDVPVPAGYAISPTESYSFQGSMSRSGVIHYYGPLDWSSALDFYRSELPANGWQIVETERGFNFRVLHCVKGHEKLIVAVRQARGGSRTEIQLDDITKNDLLLKGKLPSTR